MHWRSNNKCSFSLFATFWGWFFGPSFMSFGSLFKYLIFFHSFTMFLWLCVSFSCIEDLNVESFASYDLVLCHLSMRSLADSCSWLKDINLSELHVRCRSRYDEWLIYVGLIAQWTFIHSRDEGVYEYSFQILHCHTIFTGSYKFAQHRIN